MIWEPSSKQRKICVSWQVHIGNHGLNFQEPRSQFLTEAVRVQHRFL